jgi:transposase-like protein
MTSRTNGNSEGENQRGSMRLSPAALQPRRQEAMERYLAGEPIEVICREMSCSKSWLYKWKNRYQVTESDWVEERSRRPQTSPTKTPEALEAEIVRLGQPLSPHGSGSVSADVIREHLRQHGGDWVPSRRTISRILKRQAKEVNARSFPS